MIDTKKTPDADAIAMAIKPGCLYCQHHIARKFSVPSSAITELLAKMVSKGILSRVKPHGRRNHYYCTPGSEPSFEKLPIDETVARPRTWVVLTGEISGYTNEMRQRVELAMLGRGRG